MHLGESGHEEFALGVDALRVSWNSYGRARPYGSNASIANDDGLPRENALTIHWQHCHVDEGERAGCSMTRSVAGEKRRDEGGEEQYRSSRHSPS